MLTYEDLVELARLCVCNARITTNREVADESGGRGRNIKPKPLHSETSLTSATNPRLEARLTNSPAKPTHLGILVCDPVLGLFPKSLNLAPARDPLGGSCFLHLWQKCRRFIIIGSMAGKTVNRAQLYQAVYERVGLSRTECAYSLSLCLKKS